MQVIIFNYLIKISQDLITEVAVIMLKINNNNNNS
jgi:hypothetical protein